MTRGMKSMNLLCDPNYFHCEPLKVTMRKQTCLDRQAAMHKQGETCVYISCQACEQGQKISNEKSGEGNMGTSRIRGKCSNCDRDGLMVQKSGGLCGSCQFYIAGVTDEKERASELARAKEKFTGGKVHNTGRRMDKRKVVATPKEPPTPAFTTTSTDELKANTGVRHKKKTEGEKAELGGGLSWVKEGQTCLNLWFTDADMDLFRKIEASAERSRRNIDQQILWIVEQQLGMEIHNG